MSFNNKLKCLSCEKHSFSFICCARLHFVTAKTLKAESVFQKSGSDASQCDAGLKPSAAVSLAEKDNVVLISFSSTT